MGVRDPNPYIVQRSTLRCFLSFFLSHIKWAILSTHRLQANPWAVFPRAAVGRACLVRISERPCEAWFSDGYKFERSPSTPLHHDNDSWSGGPLEGAFLPGDYLLLREEGLGVVKNLSIYLWALDVYILISMPPLPEIILSIWIVCPPFLIILLLGSIILLFIM